MLKKVAASWPGWLFHATLRYLAVCAAPVYLILLLMALSEPGGHDADGHARLSPEDDFWFMWQVFVFITAPGMVSLMLLSTVAAWGKDVRIAAACLLSLPALLFVSAGFWQFGLFIALGITYACTVMPRTVRKLAA
ncbi:hypothetical protein ACIRRH_39680 [Kitasatospora sp. NPDC101235]|uniref:hypothetical protein n=1 Tax=Kitasatospora sp. NPDC101235 TaxID=3364101 RepID=UPI00382EA43D